MQGTTIQKTAILVLEEQTLFKNVDKTQNVYVICLWFRLLYRMFSYYRLQNSLILLCPCIV